MSRIFVFSDNLAARVEVGREPDGGDYWAHCFGCATASYSNLVEDSRERFSFEDTAEAAEIHVDACKKCADDACTTPRPHDAGHRCRKI